MCIHGLFDGLVCACVCVSPSCLFIYEWWVGEWVMVTTKLSRGFLFFFAGYAKFCGSNPREIVENQKKEFENQNIKKTHTHTWIACVLDN